MGMQLLLFILIFLFTATAQWRQLPGGGAGKAIAVENGTIWVIGSDNGIYYHQNGQWRAYGTGTGRGLDIAVKNGVPYVIGTDNGIYYGTGNGWQLLPGGGLGKAITIGSGGRIWVIGMGNNIHWFNGSGWVTYANGAGQGKDIAVHNGVPYVVGMDNMIWVGTGNNWRQHEGKGYAKRIAFDNYGQLWMIGADNKVYRFNGSWGLYGTGMGYDIDAYNGIPHVIGLDYAIWLADGQTNVAANQPQQSSPPVQNYRPPQQQQPPRQNQQQSQPMKDINRAIGGVFGGNKAAQPNGGWIDVALPGKYMGRWQPGGNAISISRSNFINGAMNTKILKVMYKDNVYKLVTTYNNFYQTVFIKDRDASSIQFKYVDRAQRTMEAAMNEGLPSSYKPAWRK